MSKLTDLLQGAAKSWPFERLPASDWSTQKPTYAEANPAVIQAALARAQRRPSGNWFAFAASSQIATKAWGTSVGGVQIVAWRAADGALRVGPRACPHLGADLATAPVECGALVCPWHGLRLSDRRHGAWRPFPSHDDGVLCWVRLDAVGGESPTDAPMVPQRPPSPRLAAVVRLEGVCEPCDVVANRLDPWHGAWFHPYSFTDLKVLSSPAAAADLPEECDRFVVAVTFRFGRLGVPVIAEFTTPGPRTVVMRIVDGEGQGSVVETHATPLAPGRDGLPRTAVVEATIAHSDRPQFSRALLVAPALRSLMGIAATRLWRDDLVYAERLYELRS
ncbi:MAG: Rieske (2Fe-2S) protein [Actinomycetia bacterium]|nr:Rieske (2Fe-2S) protein [Actinomycetes bacterium]MCH9708085.1 Rieske (2Fe-2S) protein [Actinomycetes bacterium]MCH9767583.1 Rieske (2Fe-2S) protein [Actinomycetes bacterium]